MNRPEKKNALTLAMYEEMTRALREADESDAIRCVMIAGAPGAYSPATTSPISSKPPGRQTSIRVPIDFLNALVTGRKPLVAAVGGVAVGIGTTMLLHCDHVVAGDRRCDLHAVSQACTHTEAASTMLAPMRMGYARAFSLLVMGRPLTAAEAKDAGIVNTVVDAAEVDEVALAAAHEIAALPPGTVAVTRDADARQYRRDRQAHRCRGPAYSGSFCNPTKRAPRSGVLRPQKVRMSDVA